MSTPAMPRTTAGGLSRCRRFLVLAICCASVIVAVMDISIVNVALPVIGHDLHASESGSLRVPLLFGPGQSGRGAGWDAGGVRQLRRDVARFRR